MKALNLIFVLLAVLMTITSAQASDAQATLTRTLFTKADGLFSKNEPWKEQRVFGSETKNSANPKPAAGEIQSANLQLHLNSADQKTSILIFLPTQEGRSYIEISKKIGGVYKWMDHNKKERIEKRVESIRIYHDLFEIHAYPDSDVRDVSTQTLFGRVFIGNNADHILLDGYKRSEEFKALVRSFPDDAIWARAQSVEWQPRGEPLVREILEPVNEPTAKRLAQNARLALKALAEARIDSLEPLETIETKISDAALPALSEVIDLVSRQNLLESDLLRAMQSVTRQAETAN